jgi:hypothetical protein
MHTLISLFVISFALMYYIISFLQKERTRNIRLPLSFAIIFTGWLGFQAPDFFRYNIVETVQYLINFAALTARQSLGRGLVGASSDYTIAYWTMSVLMAVVLGLAFIGLIVMLAKRGNRKMINDNSRKIIIALILAYIAGAAPLLALTYGGEIFQRLYFILLPFSAFLIAFLVGAGKRTAIVLILALLLLMPFANFAEECTTFTSSSELSGASFFQKNVPSSASYLYEFPALIFYFDTYGPPNFRYCYRVAKARFNETYALSLVNSSEWNYFIESIHTKNYYQWYLGFDLGQKIVNATPLDRIYDNWDVKIFEKP